LYLLVGHVVLITVGYAAAAKAGLLFEVGQLLWTYPGVLAAAVGFGLLITAGVSSYRRVRRRMAYETWWAVHLYTYLALLLAFSHQVHTGASFVGHRWNRVWWTALWVGTLGAVVVFRLGVPVWRSLRHRLRIVGVRAEGPGVWSILLEGRHLEGLAVAGGQFLQWRFLRRGLWWQAHPYSLSAAPSDRFLRITVKELGDHSTGLAALTPGTWVGFEGPYGVFTAQASVHGRVLLIGAGVGSTPIRALLDELPRSADVVVILRGSTVEDLVHRQEFHELIRGRRRGLGRLHELIGPRDQVRLDAGMLGRLVPDIRGRDVYVCGPEGFTTAVVAAAQAAGVPKEHIHRESFAF
jgi:ferredoxin-NADP reductase